MTVVRSRRPRPRVLRVAVALLAACLLVPVTAAPPASAQTTAGGDATTAPATTTARAAVAPRTTLQDVEKELMCSTCRVPLAQSDAPQAQQERQTIERLIAEGRTKDEIIDEMVRIYSESVLIDPPEAGVRTLRWLVPALAALLGFSLVAYLVVRWRRSTRAATGDPAGDPAAGWGDAPGGHPTATPPTAPGRTGERAVRDDDGLSDADRARLDADLDRHA